MIGSGLNDGSIIQLNGYALAQLRYMHKRNAVKLKFSLIFIVRVHLIIDFELINALQLIPSH